MKWKYWYLLLELESAGDCRVFWQGGSKGKVWAWSPSAGIVQHIPRRCHIYVFGPYALSDKTWTALQAFRERIKRGDLVPLVGGRR